MNTLVQIRKAAIKARFTASEFLQMSEAGAFADMKVELVDGELERMTPPMSSHGQRQISVGIALAAVVSKDRLIGEVGIVFNDDTVLACDAAILCMPVAENRMLAPEDIALVIEVAETTIARDMAMKRIKYAAAAIPTYWVVDGARSVIHVFAEPVDGDYASISTVRFGQPLAVPGSVGTIVID